jgi:hypothetical protein
MNRVKAYFRTKTAEQVFSACLLATCVIVMIICVIARLCGCLWFSADPSLIKEPNKVWQEIIKALLLIFELVFVYKLLCRATWFICIVMSVVQTALGLLISYLTNNSTFVSVFNIVFTSVVSILFIRHWFVLVDIAVVYILELLYGILFLVGRIGGIYTDSSYIFTYSILSTIDYKLFIVSLYLFINYFGGIKLWKSQKRLILQKDLRTQNQIG